MSDKVKALYVATYNGHIVGFNERDDEALADALDLAWPAKPSEIGIYFCDEATAAIVQDDPDQQFDIVNGWLQLTEKSGAPALSHDDAMGIVCDAVSCDNGLAGRLAGMRPDDLHTLRSALLDAVTWGEMAADDCARLDDQIREVM